jgi:hypothetical protein
VLALLALGHAPDHPRIAAALRWLGANASGLTHPGAWPPSRADSGRALLFYHTQAIAQVLSHCSEAWSAEQRNVLATGWTRSNCATAPGPASTPRAAKTIRWWPRRFATFALGLL